MICAQHLWAANPSAAESPQINYATISLVELIVDYIRSILRYKGLLKKNPVILGSYKTQKGIVFNIRKDVWDSCVIMETWWLQIYTKHIRLPGNAVVIDIGAHIGSFSIYAATQHYKHINILCFEPDRANFALLKKNIVQNKLQNSIKAYNIAIAKTGQNHVLLTSHPNNFGMHSIVQKYKNEQTKKRKVPALSLSKVFEKDHLTRCDLLKLDCEGAEYQILYNTPKRIFNKIQNIVLEFHPGGNIDDLRKFLESFGFQTNIYQALPIPLIDKVINLPILLATKKSAIL